MKSVLFRLILSGLILTIVNLHTGFSQDLHPAQWPSLVGYWKFQDTSDLTKATVGNDLILVGDHEWVPGAYYGDTAVSIAIGSYYKCYHQIPPNGGGDSVNRYSLMFDFKVLNFDAWHTFHQTDSTNMNDGECFIKPQDPGVKSTIGTATTGYTPDSISPEVWYRMVISVYLDSFYRYYIDGNLWLEGNMQVVDGRFALTPLLLFFADNNQEDDTIHIGSVAIFNNFLTPAEVALLGNLDPCIANPPMVFLGADTTLCENQQITLDAGTGYLQYVWSTGNTTQQVTIDTAILGLGASTVSVMIADMNNCTASDTISITFIDCTSVPETGSSSKFRVFPNPCDHVLSVETEWDHCRYSIANLAGQVVLQGTLMGMGRHGLDLYHLTAGIYQMILVGDDETIIRKIIKSTSQQ